MMFQLTFKNIIANKARIALITLAVVIGVSFVSSTFIFSDSLSKTFTQLATDVSAGTDLEVRPVNQFGSQGALTNETAASVADLDGVRAVAPGREAEDIAPIAPDGAPIDVFGVGLSWVDDAQLNTFDIVEGVPPSTGDFVMSAVTAANDGFIVGQTYGISTPTGVVERNLSGLVAFRGGEAFESQVSFTLLPLADAQSLFGGPADQLDSLGIAVADDATAATVQTAAQSIVGDQIEVVSQRTVQQEQAASFNSQIAILRNLLLGFAVVSLFVSTFIIYNTFGIILSQRVREIGLLRAIGADACHIGRSVIGEALIIGLIASVGGLLAGVGLNAALISLFGRLGAPLPAMDTIIATRTVVLAFAIGVGVTVLSAFGPARQASRVAPITAMRGVSEASENLGRRVLAGSLLTGAGIAVAGFGLFGASGTQAVLLAIGAGMTAIFLGITLLSPALARPLVHTIGAPIARVGGASGELARGNASRNRGRTANTAAALMIGLSLITTALVVGQSVKAHLSKTLDETVSADFVVSNDFEPLTSEVETQMRALPELGHVTAVSEIAVRTAAEVREAEAVSFDSLTQLFDVGISAGTAPQDAGAVAMLSESVATDLDLAIGDSLAVDFDNGGSSTFVVQAMFTDTTLLESGILLDRATVNQTLALSTVDWVAAGTAEGVKVAQATEALQQISTDFPQVTVQTSGEYRESVEAQVDQLLSIINVMLALSIVIALIGIGLTLALSVFERTREIGLLRAVGMSTRQVRRMIRWEAALIAMFGAVLGVGTGLFYGWGTVTALPDNIATVVSVPGTRLVLLIAASAIAGLAAAMLPARRAGRMNVLNAISGR